MSQNQPTPIDFAHIMPAPYLEFLGTQPRAELVLAHIVKDNESYAAWFYHNKPVVNLRGRKIETKRIMDNGAFELGASLSPDELIDIGRLVNATHLVLPDYPGQPSKLTIQGATKWSEKFKEAGFKTIFVPQGEIGDIRDFEKALSWAISDGWPLIDEIALSIIGVPNIYDVYKNKTQRTMARWHYLSTLPTRNPQLYDDLCFSEFPIHMLGLLDGVNEIALIRQMQQTLNYKIESWDSSAAVWYAHNELDVSDGTPTGRAEGKFELEVDFTAHPPSIDAVERALRNIETINRLCGHL